MTYGLPTLFAAMVAVCVITLFSGAPLRQAPKFVFSGLPSPSSDYARRIGEALRTEAEGMQIIMEQQGGPFAD